MQYGVQGSGNTQKMSVSGSATVEVTISNLEPLATYVVEVAAVSSAGDGVYSNALPVVTSGELQWSLRTTDTLGAGLLSIAERCPYLGD